MDFIIEFIKNLIQVVQGNLVSVFLMVLGSVIVIKITSNLIKTAITIFLLILFIKMLLEMGLIYFPMPI